MKKTIIIIWLSILTIHLFSYTWVPFCPDTINANNICFGVGSWKGTICTNNGMYIWEDDIMEWSYYFYGSLPVIGAAYLDNERILIAMGDGTFSDGVYTFNLQTHQFEVAEWLFNPNFLVQVFPSGKYYVGCQLGGLWESEDGLIWTSVPYFNGKSCTAMDYYDNHMVISEVSNIYNLYWSDDYGVSWQEASGSIPMITDFKFSFDGDLYGIFPSYSNSSGLYSSNDFGQTWNVEFWSDNMSAVGFDAMNTIFVGWDSPTGNNEGVAIYTPTSPPPNLAYLNEGLPDLNINKILMNPTMSAIAIFCCTDAGIYVCYDYMVGVEEVIDIESSIRIFPNPASKTGQIRIKATANIKEVSVFTQDGTTISSWNYSQNTQQVNLDIHSLHLNSGSYLIKVKTDKKVFAKKLILH